MICTHFSHMEYVLRIHLVKISYIFIKYEPSTERSKGLGHERIFGSIRGEQSWFFMNLKNPPGTWETLETTYLDLWKNTGPSRAKLSQRRYAVRIRPMESRGLVNVGQIFELFIELYRICTHFSYMEYALRIHLVKISLIFIKYEPSAVRPKGLAHGRFVLTQT